MIFNKACPDVILANKRIDKVNTLIKYDITSIVTSRGIIKIGTPFGKKIEKNLNPCFRIPIMLIPTKIDSAKLNVKII